MRTLIRHTETGSYFQAPDTWTKEADKAFDFRFVERATQFIATWDLKEVELVFAFDDLNAINMVASEKLAPRIVR